MGEEGVGVGVGVGRPLCAAGATCENFANYTHRIPFLFRMGKLGNG